VSWLFLKKLKNLYLGVPFFGSAWVPVQIGGHQSNGRLPFLPLSAPFSTIRGSVKAKKREGKVLTSSNSQWPSAAEKSANWQ